MDNSGLIVAVRTRRPVRSFFCGALACFLGLIGSGDLHAAWEPRSRRPVAQGPDHRLVYSTDERGNRIPDFSYSGYMAGVRPIPDVPIRVLVPVAAGHATERSDGKQTGCPTGKRTQ